MAVTISCVLDEVRISGYGPSTHIFPAAMMLGFLE